MKSAAVLVLSLLVTFCNQLETAAQTTTSIIPSDNTTVSQTDSIPAVISSTMEMTNPDMTRVDVLTLTVTDMINVSTVPVPLSPTNTIMMTSLLPMSSSFMMTIGTTAMTSPSMDVANTISTPTTTSSTATTSSYSAVPTTTTRVITTNNPKPVPENDGGSDSGFSTGAIISIAAGGGAAVLFIIVVITCYCCWRHRKHHHDELILMSPTIQTRPENCVIQRHDGLRDSKRSQLSFTGSLRSLRNSFRKPRGKDPDQSEGVKLMYQTPL